MSGQRHPMKISIVTPVRNGESYLAETIHSVISQRGDFSLEYIIIDGGSQDRTGEILSAFQRLLASGTYPVQCRGVSFSFISEKDTGMYDAINKGFDRATGDIFAWINADDIYLPGAFSHVTSIFERFSRVQWIKGITSYINGLSEITQTGRCFIYNQQWLKEGVYGRELYFIQQDSTFWRGGLWKAVGGIPPHWKYAGDYWLWTAFADKAPLYSVNAHVSCFRRAEGQLSSNRIAYRQELEKLSPHLHKQHKILTTYLAYEPHVPRYLRKFLHRLLFGKQIYFLITRENQSDFVIKSGEYHALSYILARTTDYPSYFSLEIS
jgi:glycosyltransferase involved in cell wall biosynthesis